jgi:hypothetical protein
MIPASFAIMRLFFHKVSVIFNFQHTFANVEYDAAYQCCKIPCLDYGAHHEKRVSIRCHLQNGVYIVHLLQDQTGSGQRVPDLGCKQDGEEESI